MDITIKNTAADFFGDRHDQNVYLTVELHDDNNTATVQVDTRFTSDTATPIEVWDGRILRWERKTGGGVVSMEALNDLVTRLRPLLETVAEGRIVEPSNSGPGKCTIWETPEAKDAYDEIDAIVESFDWWNDQASVWTAKAWIESNWPDTADQLGLELGATDADKARAEATLIEWADGDGVKLTDADEAIDWLLEKMAEAKEAADEAEFGAVGMGDPDRERFGSDHGR